MIHNCNRFSPPAWSMFTQRARLNRKKIQGRRRAVDQSQFRDRGLSQAPWVLLRASIDDTLHHAEMHSSPCSDFRCRSRDKRAPGVLDPTNASVRFECEKWTIQRVLTQGDKIPRERGKRYENKVDLRNAQKLKKKEEKNSDAKSEGSRSVSTP